MKKALVILSIIAAAISLTSCHIDGATVWSETYTVHPSQWKSADDMGFYFYVTIPVDRISKSVVDRGAVDAYMYIQETDTWAALPFSYPLYTYGGGSGSVITSVTGECVRFEWAEGEVTFILQDMIADYPSPVTADMIFRVTVTR